MNRKTQVIELSKCIKSKYNAFMNVEPEISVLILIAHTKVKRI